MLRRESALLLFITAALFVLMFPQSIIADRASCSLTVHSCISQSGDKTSGTAVGDPGVPDDASPLPGVLYSLWKVGDVASQTLDGTVTLCACHINDEFIALLTPGGLPPDAGSPDEEPYYNLSKIQDAWEEAVKKDEAALTEQRERSQTASKGMFKGGLEDHGEQTVKYHTACHLLLAALQKLVSPDIVQKGSNITADRVRFDFNLDHKMTPEEITAVENQVNEWITADLPVVFGEYEKAYARDTLKAHGQFWDKYPEILKVYTIGNFDNPISREVCGGPHV